MGSIGQFFVRIWRNITIEPIVVFYLTAVGLVSVIRPNLLIDKACLIKLNYTEEVCQDLQKLNDTELLNNVQRVVADYERTLNLAATVPRVLFTLLAGPWSDRHGRKFLILVPIIGQAVLALTLIINVKFFEELPFEALYMEFINELSGNFIVYYLGVYSYMADITLVDERSSRIGVLDGTDYISTMFGTYISGPIFDKSGYYAVFSTSLVFALLGLIYAIFFVQESRSSDGVEGKSEEASSQTEEIAIRNEDIPGYGSAAAGEVVAIKDEEQRSSMCCHLSDVTASLKVVLKPRADNKRLMIGLLLFNFACYIFAYNGTEGTHRYLFTSKQYDWDEQQYTTFLAVYRIGYLLSLWLWLPLCSKLFKLHDATTLIVACIIGAVGWSIPAFIEGETAFIIGFVLAVLTPVGTVISRSLISRCVNMNEVGSIFALISVISAVSSSAMTAAFQAIYSATLDTFPAAFLIINSSLLLLTLPNNLYLRKQLR